MHMQKPQGKPCGFKELYFYYFTKATLKELRTAMSITPTSAKIEIIKGNDGMAILNAIIANLMTREPIMFWNTIFLVDFATLRASGNRDSLSETSTKSLASIAESLPT